MNVKPYWKCSQYLIYYVTKSIRSSLYSLVDRRDNGGVAGSYVIVFDNHPDRKVEIYGIDNHNITSIPLVTAEVVTSTIKGEVIVMMNQHAHYGKNKTIHSSPQIENYKNIADALSIKVCGGKYVATAEKHNIPMSILGSLSYM